MTIELMKSLIKAAKGETHCDLVLKNAHVVDVFSGKLLKTDVGIRKGYIVGLGDYKGNHELDLTGKFISPALIDAHIHIESTLSTCKEFSRVSCPHGVTTVIADPHEIANVMGIDGIRYMIDASKDLPVDFHFMLSSCVPATNKETSGARIDAAALNTLYIHHSVLGLAEVMDVDAVKGCDEDMLKKLLSARNRGLTIDGHGAGLSPEEINVYSTAGITTDHECVTREEAEDRISKGMYVLIREGTVAKDFDALIGLVTKDNLRRFAFCTDDIHISEIMENGSIDNMVRKAVAYGIDPVDAIRMGSLNAAECYHLKEIGAVAPGYKANLVILDDLDTFAISTVLKLGKTVYADHALNFDFSGYTEPVFQNSVKMHQLDHRSFTIDLRGTDWINVIRILKNSLITEHISLHIAQQNEFISDTSADLIKIAVVERHKDTGGIATGIVNGFRLKRGAVATTISHDSHNIVVIGTNDYDMVNACNKLQQMGGGIVIAAEGKILYELPLEIAGLISSAPAEETVRRLMNLNEISRTVFADLDFNPFLTLSFLTLSVIPELKITDKGLYSTARSGFIPVGHDNTTSANTAISAGHDKGTA